jgi:hypothetical protein
VKARAATAFTDAFNLASAVSVGIVLILAVALVVVSRPRRAETAEELVSDMGDLDLALVPVGTVDRSE